MRRTVPWPVGPFPLNEDGSAPVPVWHRTASRILWARVDVDDYARVRRYRWVVDPTGYPIANVWSTKAQRNAHVLMHRLVARAPAGWQVDHIRRDVLDCRRRSLRRATPSQNAANRVVTLKRKSSRYRGVTLHRQTGRWQAALKCQGRCYYGGLFDTEEAAARRYDALAREHFGRFAIRNNLPPEGARKRDRAA